MANEQDQVTSEHANDRLEDATIATWRCRIAETLAVVRRDTLSPEAAAHLDKVEVALGEMFGALLTGHNQIRLIDDKGRITRLPIVGKVH